MTHHVLDYSDLFCPMPIVRLFKACASAEIGDTLEILSNDYAFPHDVKAWCEQTGQTLLQLKVEGKHSIAIIKKVKT
jgi:tRNA 2-thiouridine synthesizing protein A